VGAVLADSFFATSNYIEAGLWGVIGVGFVVHAIAKRGAANSVIAAVTFVAFSLSDVIEASTGAWWRRGGCSCRRGYASPSFWRS